MSQGTQDMIYKVGDIVAETGIYVCVPCGYKKHLKKRERFPACIACMDKKEHYIKGMELWEKVESV